MKRVYLDNHNGTCTPLAVCLCKDGSYAEAPINPSASQTVTKQQVVSAGLPTVTAETLNTMTRNRKLPFAVAPGETADGLGTFFRNETSAKNATNQFLTFTFDNTYDSTQTFVIGDPSNLIALKEGLSTLSGAVVVTGTWGAESLAFFKSISGKIAYDVHNMKLIGEFLTIATPSATDTPAAISARAKSDAVFVNNDLIAMANASPSNRQAMIEPFNVTRGIEKNDFQEGIRDFPDFRFQFNPLTGLKISLQSQHSLTINVDLMAVGNMHGMLQV